MEGKIRRHFDQIVTAAKSLFNNIKIEEDISVKRALLQISGKYESFEVKVTEIIDENKRKYAYYLINKGVVEYGCDNAPDIKALKIKYGKDYSKHLNEPIPHSHGKGKKTIELTDEMDAKEFFKKIKAFNK
jgi:hypothetical protein